ncbi:MAG: family 43 glycosylhydrolase, partial [Solirubrobacteraceae bacterium]
RIPFEQAVFPCDFPDPMLLRAQGAWFAYASATGWEEHQHAFPILRSTDLRHWRFAGDALANPPSWSSSDLWGPSVLFWHGRYLLFYNAKLRGGPHCLAVATAPAPQGPFVTRRRLACRSGRRRGFIDPAPLVAPGHRLYLFFSVDSPRHSLAAMPLAASGLRAAGPVRTLLGVSRRWGLLRSETVEGPWPLQRHGFYYLFYSAGSWSLDYRMAYAVARSPLGPYLDSAPVPILAGSAQLPAPGGGSVLAGGGGPDWLAFAAWSGAPGYALGSERTMRIAPLRWTSRGIPQVVLSGS